MSAEDKKYNFLDKYVNKKETALSLATLGVGGLFAITFADLGLVAVGLKEVSTLPQEMLTYSTVSATALLGYVLGKKDKD